MNLRLTIDVKRFVRQAIKQSKEPLGHVVIIYEFGREYSWPQMRDEKFRNAVLKALSSSDLVEAKFSPPDSYDDWTFHAYRRDQNEPDRQIYG